MANEAERVTVELVAKVDGFDGRMKQSADSFGGSMKKIEQSASGAEKASTRLTATLGGSRVALGQFGSTTNKAANDAVAGFNALTGAAHGNTVAMRETLVVARELAVGNFTRLPGSLSILSQAFVTSGKGARGFTEQLLSSFGIIRKSIDEEAAAEATQAIAAAESIKVMADKAAANIAAADTEAALARAQLAVATTATETAAAEARLAAAHEAMTAAAGEAAIAQVALAEAEGRAATAAAAASATITTSFGPIGTILLGVATAAGVLFGAFKTMQATLSNDHTLDDYANSLGLTKKEMRELRKEVGDLSDKEMRDLNARMAAFALTWGDVFEGLKKAASDALDLSSAWQAFITGTQNAFKSGLAAAEAFAAGSYGVVVGTFRTIQQFLGAGGTLMTAFANFFRGVENVAIQAWNGIGAGWAATYNAIVDKINTVTGAHLGHTVFDPAKLVPMAKETGKAAGKSFSENVADATAEAQAKIAKDVAVIWDDIIGAAENRIKKAADAIIEDRTPKTKRQRKPSDHGLADALATLDAQIKGQLQLAAAYQISDAAAIKAAALQKAEEEAIRHKGDVGVFYEKELALAVAQRLADGGKTISDLNAQAAAQKTVNDMVEAGLLPVAQMSDAVNLEMQKRELLAALAIAQEKGWLEQIAKIKAEIAGLTASEAALNAQLAREQVLRETAANRDDLDKLKLEASLIGASNKERAVALAQLEAMQKLRDLNISPTSPEGQAFIKSKTDDAAASVLSPLQEWAKDIPRTADAINNALKSVVVDGLNTFNDQLADAIVNFHSLGDVGRAVLKTVTSDLIKMALKQIEIHVLGKALGLSSIATTAAEASAAGAAWAAPAALASLATLGANAGPAAAAIVSTTALATGLGVIPKKDGGAIFGPGGPTSDKVPVLASNGEYMIRAFAASRLGLANLDYMNRTGQLPMAFAGGGAIRAVSPSNTPLRAAASPAFDASFLRGLRGIVSDAVHAMPDVKLYPTLDPAEAFEKMLASPGGQRAMFNFLNRNSGKVNSSLRR